MTSGQLFIFSAPSGTGKSTVVRRLLTGDWLAPGSLRLSISHTTRAPRAGEVDGEAYHFIDRAAFRAMVAAGEMLEYAQVFGDHYYGTSREMVEESLAAGVDVLLEIDVQGAEQVMERCPQAHSVFLMPPSYDELERRLRGRASDAESDIARRLAVSSTEIRHYCRYDYVIINDQVERSVQALSAILIEKRQRRKVLNDAVEGILQTFPPVAE
ncbi:MAG: guanylate kinase [Acidobacteriota bacterium]